MSRKGMVSGGAVVLSVGLAFLPLQAQRGPGAMGRETPGVQGPHAGRSLEIALENEAELGLTPDQVAQLQDLKTVMDRDVGELVQEMNDLRQAIRGGDVDRDEGYRQMEALRGELITAAAPLRGRVQEILTAAQHQELIALVRPRGAGQGPVGAMRGMRRAPGGRGAMGPGRRSGGIGPRWGRPARPGRGGGGGPEGFRP
jgi:Spy/CpxP family protein refolding chaperone